MAALFAAVFARRQKIRIDTSQAQRTRPDQHASLHETLDGLTENADLAGKPEPYLIRVDEMKSRRWARRRAR
ncbi:MAG: hypothetical protein ACOC0E_09120, partial [Spirochaetota bacterium]